MAGCKLLKCLNSKLMFHFQNNALAKSPSPQPPCHHLNWLPWQRGKVQLSTAHCIIVTSDWATSSKRFIELFPSLRKNKDIQQIKFPCSMVRHWQKILGQFEKVENLLFVKCTIVIKLSYWPQCEKLHFYLFVYNSEFVYTTQN